MTEAQRAQWAELQRSEGRDGPPGPWGFICLLLILGGLTLALVAGNGG